ARLKERSRAGHFVPLGRIRTHRSKKKAGGALRPFLTAKARLLEVLVDRLELVVGIDHPLVLLVLQRVALDIAPDFLGDLGARHRACADDRSKRRARSHRPHECRIGLALLPCRLLRLLLRHLLLLWKLSGRTRRFLPPTI